MYRFEYQEGLDNLLIHGESGSYDMIELTASCSGSRKAVLYSMTKKDLLELLKLVARLVTEGHGKDDKED